MLYIRKQVRLAVLLLLALAGVGLVLRKFTGSQQKSGVFSNEGTPVILWPANKTLHPSKFTKNDLSQSDIASVQKFVFFTGYERSGHSFFGSILDAHPNIVLSTAFFLFRQLVEKGYQLRNVSELYNDIYHKSLRFSHNAAHFHEFKGYTLDVPGLWQGKFETLVVIGDKAAHTTADTFSENLHHSVAKFQALRKLVGVPIMVIHVIRNPYDMISTDVLYRANNFKGDSRGKLLNTTIEHKFSNTTLIRERAAWYSKRFEAVVKMTEMCELTLLEVHSEDLVRDFRGTLQSACDVLGVECSDRYMEGCQEKAYKSVSRTRDLVEWTPKLRELIERNTVQKYPFLRGYTFENDFYNHSA